MSLSSSLLSFCFFVPTLTPLTEIPRNSTPFFNSLQFIFGLISVPNILISLFYYIIRKRTIHSQRIENHKRNILENQNLYQSSKYKSHNIVKSKQNNSTNNISNEKITYNESNVEEDQFTSLVQDTEDDSDIDKAKSPIIRTSIKRRGDFSSLETNFQGGTGYKTTSLFFLAAILNLIYCTLMIILKYIYIIPGVKTQESIFPSSRLPWWSLIVQILFSTSGPCIEAIVRLENGNPRINGFVLDTTLRIGFTLAWTIASICQYWGGAVVSVIGLILSIAWRHSLNNQLVYETRSQSIEKDLLNLKKHRNSSKNTKKIIKEFEEVSETDDTGSLSSQFIVADKKGIYSKTPFTESLNQTFSIFYYLQLAVLTTAFFSFLRLSSLFMVSNLDEFGITYKWYYSALSNSIAGIFVVIYLIILHDTLLKYATSGTSIYIGSFIGLCCTIPLPGIYFLLLYSKEKFEYIWYMLFILLPVYHVSITMATLSLRRRIFETTNEKDIPLTIVLLTTVWVSSMILGVVVGSVIHQTLNYFSRPQIVSFVIIGILHVLIICIGVAKIFTESLVNVGTKREGVINLDFTTDEDIFTSKKPLKSKGIQSNKKSNAYQIETEDTSDDSSSGLDEDDLFSRPTMTSPSSNEKNISYTSQNVQEAVSETIHQESNLLGIDRIEDSVNNFKY